VKEKTMRRIARISSAVALFAAATFGTMGSASAAPGAEAGGAKPAHVGTCSMLINYVQHTNTAYCGGWAPSQFRAWIECQGALIPWPYINVGPWRTAGGGVTSTVGCGSSAVVDAGVDATEEA
jgi:hypothetical protein